MAAQTASHLRLNAGSHPDDRELCDLVGELSVKSEDFRRLWADHEVKACMYGVTFSAVNGRARVLGRSHLVALPTAPYDRTVTGRISPRSGLFRLMRGRVR